MRWTACSAALLLCACTGTRVLERDASGRALVLVGPQPDAVALARLHRAHKLRTVVSLRRPAPGRSWHEDEARGVEAIDAVWVHEPWSGLVVPEPVQIARMLDLLTDPARQPVLVHCQSGIHRAGLVAALYRMEVSGWDPERAHRELLANGFRFGKGDRRAVEEFVRAYERGTWSPGAASAVPTKSGHENGPDLHDGTPR